MQRLPQCLSIPYTPSWNIYTRDTHCVSSLLLIPPSYSSGEPSQVAQTGPGLVALCCIGCGLRHRRPHCPRRRIWSQSRILRRYWRSFRYLLLHRLETNRNVFAHGSVLLSAPRLLLRCFEPVEKLRPLDAAFFSRLESVWSLKAGCRRTLRCAGSSHF